METIGIWCAEVGCPFTLPNEFAASGGGWEQVEESWFCANHAHVAARRARREAQIDRARTVQAEVEARTRLTTSDYAAWHEFQQEIVNYERESGERAPKTLRHLQPRQWLAIRDQQGGPIDVKAAAEEAQGREKARQAAIARLAQGS